MKREFIMAAEFDRRWKHLGLNDEDLRRLQQTILQDPQVGVVMRGTGRLRKMRFAFEGRGKSGGVRVVYVDFVVHNITYLIYVYAKNEKDNLSAEERNNIKKVIETIERALGQEG